MAAGRPACASSKHGRGEQRHARQRAAGSSTAAHGQHPTWLSPTRCARAQVTGTFERGKQKLAKPVLSGKWDEGMVAELEDGSTVQMWKKNPPPPDPTRWVCLTALQGMLVVPDYASTQT